MRRFAFLLLAFVVAPVVQSQYADVSAIGGPVTITAVWRFHTGDDPQWASPGFDDSQWPLMRLDKSWADQGHKGYSGYAWYRVKVKLPQTNTPLALQFTEMNSADEVYADSQLIGSIGRMRPTPVWLAYSPNPYSFAIPVALNGKTIALAIRVWQPADSANNYAFVGRTTLPILGYKQTIDRMSQLSGLQYAVSWIPDFIVYGVAFAVGLFSIGLFVLRRRSTEYAWAALFLFADSAASLGQWCYHNYLWPALAWIFVANCLTAAMMIFWLLFIWRFLGAPTDKLLRTGIVLLLLAPIPSGMAVVHWMVLDYADLVWVFIPLAIGTLVFARLVRLAWRSNREAQLLLIPFLLSSLMTAFGQFLRFLYYTRAIDASPLVILYRAPLFSIGWWDVSSLISYLAVAVLLMMRFTRAAERDEQLSAEMEAARAVQQVIVPESIPSVPGFALEGVYKPAGEVGGDFFQIVAAPGGSVLALIGDVSGKGMPAAMTVSLLIGTFRTLAHYAQRPGEILHAMNQRMLGRNQGGFTTCLVMRADPDGTVTAANAGHLPPYVNGKEMKIENGLPLGLAAGATYAESAFTLGPEQQLTLLTDGVVEARNTAGELFGFDRAASISTQSANQIANAAQDFGQDDDITVLTLQLAPAEVLHA